ncbi:potassium/proton antiporter [Plastoroseomonas hellenica]|uniref:potassium/proton antiporter n=1 Tax=Plastoroseomonas hellenica TaxID=2687306 RepID=UPI001BAA4778|nr:potassium/proton antiporter [Plastoroseomonas hellenica]MBR0641668.1 potassium/proton antiporter [Plastoroseomonas hellenica]
MEPAHHLLLLGGFLGLLGIAAGLVSARLGTPVLLAFLALGMLAGKGGPGGIVFDDFRAAYLIGSAALAIILFEGGLKTRRVTLRLVLWPALALATAGVAIIALLVAAFFVLVLFLLSASPPWPHPVWALALLIGAAVAPTDAAAVSLMLRRTRVVVPERVTAVLEVESGLNDPVSVFLTMLVTNWLLSPGGMTAGQGALLLVQEMAGGAIMGIAGGRALLFALRRIRVEAALCPALALMGALALFGAAQSAGASGFLAVYLAGIVIGNGGLGARAGVEHFFEAFGWLAQIVLFLMFGLLATPQEILPSSLVGLIAIVAAGLLARSVACSACLLPFGFTLRETAFASWVGLRGAVPIYLTTIPLLAGVEGAHILFEPTFAIVVISLLAQGWTIAPVARLLGFPRGADRRSPAPDPPPAVRRRG